MADYCKAAILSIFEYYTPKVVHLKNRKIGVLSRFIQLCIILYIACYVLYWKKGYQAFSPIESSSVSKLKGIIYPNFTEEQFNPAARPNMHLYLRTWDSVDYGVDPSESNGFFVMTNVIITPDQVQGKCPEDFHKKGAICRDDSDCPQGHSLPRGNGVFTGSCITSDWNDTYRVCEIKGWCPVERDIDPLLNNKAVLAGTQNFTVLIKNFAVFTLFGIRLRNIPPNVKDFHCINSKEMPTCPIFRLKDIVPGDYDKIAVKGAVVAIEIIWDCNFDYDPLDCIPKYNFRRLDTEEKYSPGSKSGRKTGRSGTAKMKKKSSKLKFQEESSVQIAAE